LLGRGVSTCATCDGAFFKNQELLVVGGGDSALEEALFLQRFASKLSVIHRRDQPRASKILQARATATDQTSFIWNATVDEVLGDKKVEGARLRNLVTGELSDIAAGGIFIAIGHTPNSSLLRGQLELDAAGYVVVGGNLKADWDPA